jgi:hypothetical protein
MELDELKNLWKKQDQNFRPRDEAELSAMLKGKSKSIVSKLKRNIWIELVLTCTVGIILLFYASTVARSTMKIVSMTIIVAFVGYSVYYIKKLMLLKSFETNSGNIRSSLEQLIKRLSSYLKYYRMSFTILYPAYFVLGVVLGGLEQGGTDRFFEVFTEKKTLITLSILALVFYFSATWLVGWLLKKLYGNHLDKLKALLIDLERE